MLRVLLVEDDPRTARLLADDLARAGHRAEIAPDGDIGLRSARERAHDVLVVDRMIPAVDGLEVVRRLRREGVETPVLFLTTMAGIGDRVDGLEAGGDDYLVKPFASAEFLARVQALGRRAPLARDETVIRAGDIEMDLLKRRVQRGGEAVELQPREFQLLEFLVRNAGAVVTRRQLLEGVWDFHFDPQTNIVETHMSRLRAKLDRGGESVIETVRGAGYVLRVPR